MPIRILRYSKKIGFILAGVLLGVCSGISSVSAAEELGSSRARAGFNRPNFNRPNFNRPNFNRPNFNRPNFNRPDVRPIVGQGPFVRPIEVNQVFVEEDNEVEELCVVEEEAFLVKSDECIVVVKDEED